MTNNWKEKFLNRIVCGDSHFLLQEIPENSIHLVITSPPYFQQRDYDGLGIGNEKRVEEYVNNLLKIFNECVRITKDDGSIVFNLGDKYENSSLLMVPHKFAMEAIKVNPIKLVNIITWVKLNPTPRQFKRRLVSSTEPFFHFVKNDSYYYDIDSFTDHKNLLRSKSNGGNKIGQGYFELIKKSSLSEKEKQQAKKELLEVIQEVKSGKIESFRMKIRGIHSEPFGGQEGGRKIQLEKKGFTIIKILGNGLKKDVIECPVETIKGSKHPAIYPEYIIQELIRLLTHKGDVVLDPFIGSGTTAVAAKKLNRDYIGLDINPSYCKYAERKLKDIQPQNNLLEFLI
jgi:site-specific DNA-methyltransferase (adenine-specific)